MAKEYLDKTGLTYLWSKLKSHFAPLASPSFTGTPTAPTASTGTNNSQIANTEFVNNVVNSVSIVARGDNFSGNVNDLKTSGIWYATTSATNIPSGYTAAHIIVFANRSRIVQMAVQYSGQRLSIRTSANSGSSWGEWRAINS